MHTYSFQIAPVEGWDAGMEFHVRVSSLKEAINAVIEAEICLCNMWYRIDGRWARMGI